MLKTTVAALTLLCCVTYVDARGALLRVYDDLDKMCRGWSGDDPHTNEACDARADAEQALKEAGFCHSEDRDTSWRWVRCSH